MLSLVILVIRVMRLFNLISGQLGKGDSAAKSLDSRAWNPGRRSLQHRVDPLLRSSPAQGSPRLRGQPYVDPDPEVRVLHQDLPGL